MATTLRGSAAPQRRRLLGAAVAWCLAAPLAGSARPEAPRGAVREPGRLASFTVISQAGQVLDLATVLRGRCTAVQLMFAGCTSSCPVQGALFAAIAAPGLPRDVQLLSLSIDALGDDPPRLSRWLARFGRVPAWSAAVPRVEDVEPLSAWLKGMVGTPGTHTAQVFLFDREARLRYRSGDYPTAQDIRARLAGLAQNDPGV